MCRTEGDNIPPAEIPTLLYGRDKYILQKQKKNVLF